MTAGWTIRVDPPDPGGDPPAAAPVGEGHTVTVGRSPRCDLTVADPRLSREHFAVTVGGGAAVVRDLTGGRNPVFARGRRVDIEAELRTTAAVGAGGVAVPADRLAGRNGRTGGRGDG